MASYHLQIMTPDGACFDGQAEKLTVRTIEGDVCILARHINYVTALGMGQATVVTDSGERRAACIGGLLSVHDGQVRLLPTTFEWAEDIDVERASRAQARAEETLAHKDTLTRRQIAAAEARLKRALVRQAVAKKCK